MMKFIVTENGWGNISRPLESEKNDLMRCHFYRGYIGHMSKNTHDNKIPVMGYSPWSIMDNYEWADGFSIRFGLTYIDYHTLVRPPKLSARWFGEVTKLKSLPANGEAGLPRCEDFWED